MGKKQYGWFETSGCVQKDTLEITDLGKESLNDLAEAAAKSRQLLFTALQPPARQALPLSVARLAAGFVHLKERFPARPVHFIVASIQRVIDLQPLENEA